MASRRPFDHPGVERVYYRLNRERETIVDKTHMPYALGPQRMARWRELFLTPAYRVKALPSYAIEVASNPFILSSCYPASQAKDGRGEPMGGGVWGLAERILLTM